MLLQEIGVDSDTGLVIREQHEPYNLKPIRDRIQCLEKERRVSKFCRDIDLSRNQLYLILAGKSNATEESLGKILRGLAMNWEQIRLPPS